MGSIAQIAVLPAFQHAENSEVTALVSGDEVKRKALGNKYGIKRTYSYEQYQECFPAGRWTRFTSRCRITCTGNMQKLPHALGFTSSARSRLAPNEDDCRGIIEAARRANVRFDDGLPAAL